MTEKRLPNLDLIEEFSRLMTIKYEAQRDDYIGIVVVATLTLLSGVKAGYEKQFISDLMDEILQYYRAEHKDVDGKEDIEWQN